MQRWPSLAQGQHLHFSFSLTVCSQCAPSTAQSHTEQPGIQRRTEFLLFLPRVTVTWRPGPVPCASGALGEPVLGLHKAFGSHTKEVPVISKAARSHPLVTPLVASATAFPASFNSPIQPSGSKTERALRHGNPQSPLAESLSSLLCFAAFPVLSLALRCDKLDSDDGEFPASAAPERAPGAVVGCWHRPAHGKAAAAAPGSDLHPQLTVPLSLPHLIQQPGPLFVVIFAVLCLSLSVNDVPIENSLVLLQTLTEDFCAALVKPKPPELKGTGG